VKGIVMRNAAVMLIVRDGLILGISRRHDKTKFGLPGGKVEENDRSTAAAAQRETLEETGVHVLLAEHIFTRVEPRERPEGEDFHTYCYFAMAWEGEPRNSEEGEIKWLTEAELTSPEIGAFADYNRRTLEAFKKLFPNIPLI
jgi:8-oxo-dGTP pyrophosphatase MutT (NUDIX family)